MGTSQSLPQDPTPIPRNSYDANPKGEGEEAGNLPRRRNSYDANPKGEGEQARHLPRRRRYHQGVPRVRFLSNDDSEDENQTSEEAFLRVLKREDEEWKQELQCEEDVHDENMGLYVECYNTLRKKVEDLMPPAEKEYPGKSLAEHVRECYVINRKDSLACASAVQKFQEFVDSNFESHCRITSHKPRATTTTTSKCGIPLPKTFDGGYDPPPEM